MVDKRIEAIIDECGWYEGRSINIEYEFDDLQREGFAIPEGLLLALLKEFWNIRVEFAMPNGRFGEILLNIEAGRGWIGPEYLRPFERVLQTTLYPVGLLHFETGLLLATPELSFYLSCEAGLYRLGKSFEEFMDNTINQKPIELYHF